MVSIIMPPATDLTVHVLHQLYRNEKTEKNQWQISHQKGQGHGFGLVRIDDIVERYVGYLSRNSEDGAFTTEILLFFRCGKVGERHV